MNSTINITTYSIETYEYQKEELNLFYAVCEVLVAFFAVVGNALVIFVFRKERRLRRRTNYYIVSLAFADFLVGLLGIPFAILSSIGLPTNLHACLFTASLLVVLCTISIFCLVAVSIDRYWAILHPMGYSRNVRTKTALVIISVCWMAGSVVGFLPLMGWHKDAPENGRCFFLNVMDYNYLVFLYFGTIITPALVLAAFYAHIYRVVLKQLRQIVTMNPENGTSTSGCASGGTMLRMLGAAQKREVKATQNLAIIVLFFMLCWIPLYTVNCILAFCRNCHINSTIMLACIILSHLNSAGNPLLYAYHLRDFRSALKNFFCSIFGLNVPNLLNHHHHNHNQQQLYYNQQQRTSFLSNNNYTTTNNYRLNSLNSSRNLTTYNLSSDKKLNNSFSNNFNQRRTNINNNNNNNRIAPKISTIVKNSAQLAVATAGELNRDIFKIPEGSSDSHHSEDNNRDIIHPLTTQPYQPSLFDNTTSQINQAFIDTSDSLEDEDDDVFYDEQLRFNYIDDSENSNSLSERIISKKFVPKIIPNKIKSNSSPQLSRNLFLIENEINQQNNNKFVRSYSFVDNEDGNNTKSDDNNLKIKNFKLSPFKMVGGIFKNNTKRSLNRSLSDDGAVASNDLVNRKANGTINSCGT